MTRSVPTPQRDTRAAHPEATIFTDLPLLPSLLGTLAEQGLTTPTEVQQRALPELLGRGSVVGISQTGTGKTLAYVLPILDKLKRMEDGGSVVDEPAEPRALVIVPTRELGDQVTKVFKTFTHATRIRVRAVLGGRPLKKARDTIGRPFDVLVATPGRLDQLVRLGHLQLGAIRMVVLDEADQLLDMGFGPQVLSIVQATPSFRQLALFSATMSDDLREFVADVFHDATLIETSRSQQLPSTLTLRRVPVPDGRRFDVLPDLLREPCEGSTILFANTRAQCDRIVAEVDALGLTTVLVRGEMDAVERRHNLRAFRRGETELLVCTDLTARGLDIEHVTRVINVHLPRTMDNYLHRAGRTARAGRSGVVVDLVTPRDEPLIEAVEAARPKG